MRHIGRVKCAPRVSFREPIGMLRVVPYAKENSAAQKTAQVDVQHIADRPAQELASWCTCEISDGDAAAGYRPGRAPADDITDKSDRAAGTCAQRQGAVREGARECARKAARCIAQGTSRRAGVRSHEKISGMAPDDLGRRRACTAAGQIGRRAKRQVRLMRAVVPATICMKTPSSQPNVSNSVNAGVESESATME